MKRSGSAVWQGTGKEGTGTVSTPGGALNGTTYSASSRFENGIGTNPEELIAAAHAGCYSMALSFQLSNNNTPPQRIDTTATIDMQKEEAGWAIKSVHLAVEAKVQGIDNEKFKELAENAKKGCPVSKLLNVEITMDAKLLS